jgi:2-oxoglutarate dehydrogenase E2 component (dihydrolipoamide succinyltransferase)
LNTVYKAAAPPPKQEQSTDASKPKDGVEPADQQVDKATPAPPSPSQSDKKSDATSQDKLKESKKEAKEESSKKEKKSNKDKENKSATERPAAGSRGETRVCTHTKQLLKNPSRIVLYRSK